MAGRWAGINCSRSHCYEVRTEPHRKARYSRTGWMQYGQSDLLLAVRQRAMEITGWPEDVMNATEDLQL
eukprot:2368830-Amphidinium_carterae.3